MISYRSLKKLSAPASEPVTLAETKQHLRIDTDTDDALLGAYITAAREYCEDYLDRTLTHTPLRMTLDGFPAEIALPAPPMASSGTATAVSVTYVANSNGQTATLSSAEYRVDRDSTPGVIRPLYGGSWPSHLNDENSVTVTWHGGYGASASDVPRTIRHAVMMIVGTWYERRLAIDNVSAAEVPLGARALLDMARWGSYR